MSNVTIRTAQTDDAEQILRLGHQLDAETQFMVLEPGERQLTVEQQRQRIESILGDGNSMILVAEHAGVIVGFLAAYGGEWRRIRHSAYLVIGIMQAYTGQGIGAQLFTALEAWALDHQLHRLELNVMTHNERAIRLYTKMGFQIEGTKKDSLLVNGAYVDEYYMAKLLPQN